MSKTASLAKPAANLIVSNPFLRFLVRYLTFFVKSEKSGSDLVSADKYIYGGDDDGHHANPKNSVAFLTTEHTDPPSAVTERCGGNNLLNCFTTGLTGLTGLSYGALPHNYKSVKIREIRG